MLHLVTHNSWGRNGGHGTLGQQGSRCRHCTLPWTSCGSFVALPPRNPDTALALANALKRVLVEMDLMLSDFFPPALASWEWNCQNFGEQFLLGQRSANYSPWAKLYLPGCDQVKFYWNTATHSVTRHLRLLRGCYSRAEYRNRGSMALKA